MRCSHTVGDGTERYLVGTPPKPKWLIEPFCPKISKVFSKLLPPSCGLVLWSCVGLFLVPVSIRVGLSWCRFRFVLDWWGIGFGVVLEPLSSRVGLFLEPFWTGFGLALDRFW